MITRDDWLAALEEAAAAPPPPSDPDVLSTTELCHVFSCRRSKAERIVQQLLAAGKAERTTKVIVTIGGFHRIVPAYRLVKDGQAE